MQDKIKFRGHKAIITGIRLLFYDKILLLYIPIFYVLSTVKIISRFDCSYFTYLTTLTIIAAVSAPLIMTFYHRSISTLNAGKLTIKKSFSLTKCTCAILFCLFSTVFNILVEILINNNIWVNMFGEKAPLVQFVFAFHILLLYAIYICFTFFIPVLAHTNLSAYKAAKESFFLVSSSWLSILAMIIEFEIIMRIITSTIDLFPFTVMASLCSFFAATEQIWFFASTAALYTFVVKQKEI